MYVIVMNILVFHTAGYGTAVTKRQLIRLGQR